MSTDNPSRRHLLSAIPAAAMAASAEPQAPSARPNIILINSDQFRWDCVGAMGLNPMNLNRIWMRWGVAALYSGMLL